MPKAATDPAPKSCPCGGKNYTQCCEPLHRGAPASSAEALMRSRYSAFALNLQEYIQRSWHPSTRPPELRPTDGDEKSQWTGLKIKRHEAIDADHAIVEFVARYKVNGRAFVLQETSRFVREDGHWFYLDGNHETR